MTDSESIEVVYVKVLDEDIEVWRPVEARREGESLYRLIGLVPIDETWEFAGGERVVTEIRQRDGKNLVYAVRTA